MDYDGGGVGGKERVTFSCTVLVHTECARSISLYCRSQ